MTGIAKADARADGLATTTAARVGFSIGLIVAFACAWRTVHDLSWPAEIDLFRDLGTANALFDGNWLGDHAYLGETRWYPPLLPAMVALIARATGAATHVIYARGGPWLNLLGPIFFFAVARRWIGSMAATAALFGLLFFGPQALDAWKYATYSAWLWPFNFSRGLFFATLAAHPAFVRPRAGAGPQTSLQLGRSTLTGALLGLTFLAHPAPAVILAVAFVLYAVFMTRGTSATAARRVPWLQVAMMGCLALIFVLPFLIPLYRAYHLKVLNTDPARWVGVSLHDMVQKLIRPRTAVAVVGLVSLWKARAWGIWQPSGPAAERDMTPTPIPLAPAETAGISPSERALLLAYVSATVLLFSYGLASQLLENWHVALLPQIVPTFHFYLYLDTVELLAFGVGFMLLVRRGAAALRHFTGLRIPVTNLALGTLLAFAMVLLPGHLHAKDLSQFRAASLAFAADPGVTDLYDWLRENTRPGAVVLAPPIVGSYAIAPSGRGVVSVVMNHSNPYVSFVEREADRERMYRALRAGDVAEFRGLASRYRVSYVAIDREGDATGDTSTQGGGAAERGAIPDLPGLLRKVGRFGHIELAAIVGAPATNAPAPGESDVR